MAALVALLLAALAGGATAQPGLPWCERPYPPVTEGRAADRRAFELEVSAYFDAVSRFHACISGRDAEIEAYYDRLLAEELRRVREWVAQERRWELEALREDRAAVEADYARVLEAYRRLQ
jgi:hypothetical protein